MAAAAKAAGWVRRAPEAVTTKRLFFRVKRFFKRTGPDDGVESAKEAPHAGDDGDLLGAAAGDELLVVAHEDQVSADGGEGRHAEDIAGDRSATCDSPVAARLTVIPVDGCDAGQGGGLALVDAVEFGHLGDKGAGGDAANAGDALEEVIGGTLG